MGQGVEAVVFLDRIRSDVGQRVAGGLQKDGERFQAGFIVGKHFAAHDAVAAPVGGDGLQRRNAQQNLVGHGSSVVRLFAPDGS